MINIALQPEYIFAIGNFQITNTLLTSVLVSCLLIGTALVIRSMSWSDELFVVKGLRILVLELLKLTDMVTNDRKLSTQIFPLVATFFLFIVTANLLALIPGFLGSFYVNMGEAHFPLLRSPNSDLNTTLALALVSVAAIQYFSLYTLGLKGYSKRFIDFTSPINLILGFFEILSEAIKVLSFSFRLFGNIFAGEVLLLVIAFITPYFIPLPFMVLEIFVGVIQAFIFTILTLSFIRISTQVNIHEFKPAPKTVNPEGQASVNGENSKEV